MRDLAILRYLLVPLRTAPLLAIFYFSVAMSISEHVGVLGIAMFFGTSALLFGYAFALLQHVADGRGWSLALSTDVLSEFAARGIGTFVLAALFYYGTYRLEQSASASLVVGLRLLFVGLLPAMVALMVMTERFFASLNPLAIGTLIARIPYSYFTLVLILGALWTIPLWGFHKSGFSFGVLWQAESFLPLGMLPVIGVRGAFIGFLGHLVAVYLWLATFACIGGMLYERRSELDLRPAQAPERETERADAELERQRDVLADGVYADLRSGGMPKAVASVQRLVAKASKPVDEYRWLYARAERFADQRLANHLAHVLVPLLLNHRATGEALGTVRQRLDGSPDFRPQTSAQLLRLVHLAFAAGDRATARRLLGDFEHHYPDDPLAMQLAKAQAQLQEH